MKAIEEFIEALKIGETLKERLQTVKQEQGASWQGSEDYSDAISYVGELMQVAAIKMLADVNEDGQVDILDYQRLYLLARNG